MLGLAREARRRTGSQHVPCGRSGLERGVNARLLRESGSSPSVSRQRHAAARSARHCTPRTLWAPTPPAME